MYGAIVYHRCCNNTIQHQHLSKKNMTLSVALFVLFYVCQIPLEVMEWWDFFSDTDNFKLILVMKIVEVVSLSHGVINVAVYAAFSSELHDVIRKRTYTRVTVHTGMPQICVNGDDVTRERDNVMEMSVIITEVKS